jgi:glycosyltransferase involved in cell wall biosynthesis
MNILQLISGADLNGAVRHAYDLTYELSARGHRVVLGHRPGAWIGEQPLPEGVERVETSFKRRRAELRRVAALLKERRIDVIHTHNSSAHLFGALLSVAWHFPFVATSHATFFQPHWWFCDRIIAPSEATARFQRWVNWIPRRRIDVIPNFINAARLRAARTRDEVRSELGAKEETYVIITVGEVFHRKNQELLVKALPALLKAGLDPLVLLVGKQEEAYRRMLDERIQQLGVAKYVRLMGQRSDIPDLLQASDVFCLPSRSEVMPIALLESMATGLPAVATNVGGVAELVRDGVDGIITKSGDTAGLAAALLRLQREPALRMEMGRAAQENVRASYSPEVCVPKILECFVKSGGG